MKWTVTESLSTMFATGDTMTDKARRGMQEKNDFIFDGWLVKIVMTECQRFPRSKMTVRLYSTLEANQGGNSQKGDKPE